MCLFMVCYTHRSMLLCSLSALHINTLTHTDIFPKKGVTTHTTTHTTHTHSTARVHQRGGQVHKIIITHAHRNTRSQAASSTHAAGGSTEKPSD